MIYLGHTLLFQKEVDDFVGHNCELCFLEMDEHEWEAIHQVADWLKMFRSATTQMSSLKGSSILSTTHAIFRGLQEHLRDIIRFLPASAPAKTRSTLLDAYAKLSDYYYQYDQSPFYTWSARKY